MSRGARAKGAGRTLEGTVRDLARRGDAVVETPAGLVLAAGPLPGERVRLAGVRRAGGVLRGELREVLDPSPQRVSPACGIADRCGGCPWMGLRIDAQRERKRRFVGEAAGLEAALEPGGSPLGYRRRARLSFVRRGERVHIGYRARRSHRVVDAERCPVLEPALAEALAGLRDRWSPLLEGRGEIALGRGEGGAAVIALRSEPPQPPALYDAARRMVDEGAAAGVAIRAGGASADAVFGDPTERSEPDGGPPLIGTVAGFSQAQQTVNRALVSRVVELAEPAGASVLELYAGHGNLTVPLAARARRLEAVEQDGAAARACRHNLAARGLRATVHAGDSAEHARGPRVDAVVLDPPRAGAAAALEGIAARRPGRIVYVSCDTATLARDIATLGRLGYRPDRAHAFDMFPQTAHVEAVVRLIHD